MSSKTKITLKVMGNTNKVLKEMATECGISRGELIDIFAILLNDGALDLREAARHWKIYHMMPKKEGGNGKGEIDSQCKAGDKEISAAGGA